MRPIFQIFVYALRQFERLYQDEIIAAAGRARHSVRADMCQPDDGAPGVTRPTFNDHLFAWHKAVLLVLGIALVPLVAHGTFRYANQVSTTGGQFNGSYPPSNLINNGFTSPTNTIDTRVDYLAAGNNYATASGTTANFDLTFNFTNEVELSGMHVWNYVFRSGAAGATSTNGGVNTFTLTFYPLTNGGGSVIGSYTGNVARAAWNALNPAQTINFGSTNAGVRSVVMRVLSNYGGSFAGMNEVAFETSTPPEISSFATSTNFVTHGSAATLSWVVSAGVTNLSITGVGNVLPFTTNGVGSVQVSPPRGHATYSLIANGSATNSLSLISLPAQDKVHIYLLIGQSNMAGAGRPYDAILDSPDARVLQFGSREGMESIWTQAKHPLTTLSGSPTAIGMGLEFAKTMLASNADPDTVICLINHAIGSSAIQWWSPGVIDNKQTNSITGLNYFLYDEAVQRATNAAAFGVIKGVLWHQGEYNSNTGNSNPSAEPELYASRLAALVDNLRRDLQSPGLPFVCGKFVPTWTNGSGTVFTVPTLVQRGLVEAALQDLPNQKFNTACVENNGLTGHEDEVIHFNAVSQRELGRRYAQQFLAISASHQFPPRLNHLHNGSLLNLSWPANYRGWRLEALTNSTLSAPGNWFTIAASASTNTVDISLNPGLQIACFRLRAP
jgi:hypothetical protein